MLMKEMRYIVDYRAVISKSEERGVQGKSLITRVHFWCCNSAVAFETIKEEARSVILASGTLAPMESFASELGMLFDVRLETGHVVDTKCFFFSCF
jgi:Rad3-related DNA helicase